MASQAKLSRITINNILLATDFSAEAQNALQCAVSVAKRYGSTIFSSMFSPRKAPSELLLRDGLHLVM